MMNEKDGNMFAWLFNEYGSRFASHYFDAETEAQLKAAQAEMKQLAAMAETETDPAKKLELAVVSRDRAIECTQLLHEQTHRVYLAVIALLAKQLTEFTEPQLPKEFHDYLEHQHRAWLSRQG